MREVQVQDVQEAVRFISHNNGFRHGLLDFSHLKHTSRDAVEEAVKYWSDEAKVIRGKEVIAEFDMASYREQRLRGYYRARFEYRKNLMDHDYQ